MTEKVLLVDDDSELVDLIRDYLEAEGFLVGVSYSGETGITAALSSNFDIIVLDVMMAGISGIQALAQIRARSTIPVIMLTARGDDADRIAGLELGADDYVPKPCTPRELTARIRAILKRTSSRSTAQISDCVVAGALTLWPAQRRAECKGLPLDLTSTEFNLLEILARNTGHPVSKSMLSEEALGRPLMQFDRSIDVHISSIRHKLGAIGDGSTRIHTVIRKGYQLTVS